MTPDEATIEAKGLLDCIDQQEPEAIYTAIKVSTLSALLAGYEAAAADIRTLEHGSLCMICRYKNSALTDLVCAGCKGTPHVIADNFEWRSPKPFGEEEVHGDIERREGC